MHPGAFYASMAFGAILGVLLGIAIAHGMRRRGWRRYVGMGLVGAGVGLAVTFAIMAVDPPTRGANRRRCMANLRAIGISLALYREKNGGQFPDADGTAFLSRLYEAGYLTDAGVFLCAAGAQTPTNGRTLNPSNCSYVGRKNTGEIAGETVLAAEREDYHGGVRIVLFLDGRVEEILEEDFQERWAPVIGD